VEDSDGNVEISRRFASITENIKILVKWILDNSELKQDKTMTIIRLKEASRISVAADFNGDNLENMRHETDISGAVEVNI
jgi:hypothetical protein